MDADELALDNNGEASGEEKVSKIFNNNLAEDEVNGSEKECEQSDENSQTGQETTIKDDIDNSKSNEGVEPNENDNGMSTTDRDTEKTSQTDQVKTIKEGKYNSKSNEGAEPNESVSGLSATDQDTERLSDDEMCSDDNITILRRGLASVRQERDKCKLMIEELQEFVKHPRGDNDVNEHPDCTKHDALQTMSTNDPSMIVQLKRRFQELKEAVSVHEHDLDQEMKLNERLKEMHKDLRDFVTLKYDQRNSKSSKPVANADDDQFNVVSHISEHYRQLQGELDKYKQEVQQLKSSLDYNTNQQKSKETSLRRDIDNLKQELQRETRQYQVTKKALDDQITVNFELADQQACLLKVNQAQNDEVEAVKNELYQAQRNINTYEGNRHKYDSILNQLQGTINEQLNQIQQHTSHIRRQDQTIERLQKHVATLEEEQTNLTLRFTKLTGAHLTRNNPNINDLSDVNRPIQLAEKYFELYDNEWTDAYEECTDAWNIDEEMCVATMLDLLRKADAECLKLLQPHRDILKTLTTVTVKLEKPAVTQDTHAYLEICSSTKDESTQTDLILVCAEDQTEPYARIDELVHANTMFNVKEEIAEIKINGEFTEEQRKAVSDMRKLCGTKLEQEGSISKIIAMKIALERGIDIQSSDNLMTYITKCAQLCWYMAIEEPPVVISFREPAADEDFDKDVYKAYTKVGKKLDFFVWPPMYLYKDGPMLCKGTAQGKD